MVHRWRWSRSKATRRYFASPTIKSCMDFDLCAIKLKCLKPELSLNIWRRSALHGSLQILNKELWNPGFNNLELFLEGIILLVRYFETWDVKWKVLYIFETTYEKSSYYSREINGNRVSPKFRTCCSSNSSIIIIRHPKQHIYQYYIRPICSTFK